MLNRKGGIGEGGWVQPNRADHMVIYWLSLRNTSVGSGWATAVLLCMNGLRKVLSPWTVPISSGEALFPVWVSGCQLTIASSLIGGCGLCHECVEDGSKGTCVEDGSKGTRSLGAEYPTELGT